MNQREHDTIIAASNARIRELEAALRDARDKLRRYREGHSGEYVGGIEYTSLMQRIEYALEAPRGPSPLNLAPSDRAELKTMVDDMLAKSPKGPFTPQAGPLRFTRDV